MIALNSTQEAEGELYVDDGKTFEFAQVAYIHRRFVFSKGKLTSSNIAPPSTPRKLRFSSECIIERIILLGWSAERKAAALIEPANQKVEIELGPLYLGRRSSPSVVTIRKPDVGIEDDWSIKIL